MELNKLLSTKEISETFNVSEQTIRHWTKTFDIPYKRYNGYKFNPDMIEIFKVISSMRGANGEQTIKRHITPLINEPILEDKTLISEQYDTFNLQELIKSEISKVTEIASKYAMATYQIGQLETENKFLKDQIKLLPEPQEHIKQQERINALESEVDRLKSELNKPWWKKLFMI